MKEFMKYFKQIQNAVNEEDINEAFNIDKVKDLWVGAKIEDVTEDDDKLTVKLSNGKILVLDRKFYK